MHVYEVWTKKPCFEAYKPCFEHARSSKQCFGKVRCRLEKTKVMNTAFEPLNSAFELPRSTIKKSMKSPWL